MDDQKFLNTVAQRAWTSTDQANVLTRIILETLPNGSLAGRHAGVPARRG
ncbi:MAG: hypothetical protein ACRDRR_06055 [Pseudonocardiaceae bacterium]